MNPKNNLLYPDCHPYRPNVPNVQMPYPTYLPQSNPDLKAGSAFSSLPQVKPFFPYAKWHTFVLIVGALAGLILIDITLDSTSSMLWALYATQAILLVIIYY
jgi:hypothetical protein